MRKTAFILGLLTILTLHAQPRIWNMNSLDKARISPIEASKAIIRDADKLLNKSILTIMDKKLTPPSGDKHDYMSMGRYWWPNPETKNGLPYIRKDGVVNPEIDKLDRRPLGDIARTVSELSLAFYLTSDDKYASKAVKDLRIWFINKDTRMNPNMNYGQTIPGRLDGNGRGEGVLDTYSFVEMLDGVELLKSSGLFTKNDQQAVKEWFSAYLNWMLTSEIGNEERTAKNNHGTAFDVQAARYALFVGKDDVARKIIEEFPAKRLFKQIEPDGAQSLELARTTAFGYSVFNLTHFLDMSSIARTMRINLLDMESVDGRSIMKAIDFLVPFIGKHVTDFPYKQIKDWDGVQQKLCWQLYRIDKMLSKPAYKKYYNSMISNSAKDNELLVY